MTGPSVLPVLDDAGLLRAWEDAEVRHGADRAVAVLAAALPADADPAFADPAGWSLGARDAALLRLHVALAGPMLEVLADCAGCGSPLEIRLDVPRVIQGYRLGPADWSTVEVAGVPVRFRSPTSADLVAAGGLRDPDAVRAELLRRCVDGPVPLTEAQVAAVSAAIEAADPLVDVRLDVSCVDCGGSTGVLLDVPVLVLARVRAAARRLVGEVAALAGRYGWAEADILAMSPGRRRAYLEAS